MRLMIAAALLLWSLPASAQSIPQPAYDDAFRLLTRDAFTEFQRVMKAHPMTLDTTATKVAQGGMTKTVSQKISVPDPTPAEWDANVRKQLAAAMVTLAGKLAPYSRIGLLAHTAGATDTIQVSGSERGQAPGQGLAIRANHTTSILTGRRAITVYVVVGP